MLLFAPVLPDASSSRVTVSGERQAVSVVPGAPAANVSEATRPAGGENQGMVEGHGIAAPYHRTVTVPIKSSHAQPETSSRAGRSLSVTDRCIDLHTDKSSHCRSYTSAYKTSDTHAYNQKKEVS